MIDAASREPDLDAGADSAIVIVVRASNGPAQNPARGLKLLAMKNDEPVADVATPAGARQRDAPIVTLHVAVSPGAYRLSLTNADGRLVEQIVIASRGWQTQIFMAVDRAGYADIVNVAITIAKRVRRRTPTCASNSRACGVPRRPENLSEMMRAHIADPPRRRCSRSSARCC